jgi:hypothetical protein
MLSKYVENVNVTKNSSNGLVASYDDYLYLAFEYIHFNDPHIQFLFLCTLLNVCNRKVL